MTKFSGASLSISLIFCALISVAGCAHQGYPSEEGSSSDEVSKDEPLSCYGNPQHYVVEGKHYHVLHSAKNYNKVGIASWYGNKFHGHLTSTRERYDMYGMTAASPELPLPTTVRVTNLENGRSVVLKVNDRGPFKSDRVLDMSYSAAKKLGLIARGTAKVRVVAIHNGHPPNLDSLAARQILQVGAFSQRENADQYSDRITQITHSPVNVRRSMVNNKPVYRVEIGPFTDQAALDSTQKILEMHGVKNVTAKYS